MNFCNCFSYLFTKNQTQNKFSKPKEKLEKSKQEEKPRNPIEIRTN